MPATTRIAEPFVAASTRGWNSRNPHVRSLLKWLKKRYDANTAVETGEIVEWDRTHGRHLFEWNDAEAAHAHRLDQARNFMDRFAFRLNGFRVRGWVNVSIEDDAGESAQRAYMPMPAALSVPSLRDQVVQDVTRRMETQAATLRFLELSQDERADILSRVGRAMASE